MLKLFYMKWNTGDWLKDPAVSMLKPSTRGIWVDALNSMHEMDQCGELQGTISDLARVCRCTSNEMRAALDDLKQRNTADVVESNGVVTLTNRRMRREWTGRKSNRDRKMRFDKVHREKDVTADVTDESTGGKRPIDRDKDTDIKLPPAPSGGDVAKEFPKAVHDALIPESLRGGRFYQSWLDWEEHRKQRGPKLADMAAQKQLKKLVEMGAARAVVAIEHSIANSYQGIFEPRQVGSPRSPYRGQTSVQLDEVQRKEKQNEEGERRRREAAAEEARRRLEVVSGLSAERRGEIHRMLVRNAVEAGNSVQAASMAKGDPLGGRRLTDLIYSQIIAEEIASKVEEVSA